MEDGPTHAEAWHDFDAAPNAPQPSSDAKGSGKGAPAVHLASAEQARDSCSGGFGLISVHVAFAMSALIACRETSCACAMSGSHRAGQKHRDCPGQDEQGARAHRTGGGARRS